MMHYIRRLTKRRRGPMIAGDFALVASVLVLGSVVGLVLVRNALLGEKGPFFTAPAPSKLIVPSTTR